MFFSLLNSTDICLRGVTGFHADLNATYPVGEIDEESKKLIRTTREALDAAIAICKPGVPFRDIGKAMSVFLILSLAVN